MLALQQLPIAIDVMALRQFCHRWHITEMALFGSVLRDDFGAESDVDVLVSFEPQVRHSLADLVTMQEEIELLFQRRVDLVTKVGIERSRNYIRKQAILDSARPIYVA
jgi:predicted nucleotidyltransferase